MLQRTNAKAGPLRIQSYREWLVVIFGLGAGLLIGAAILRDGPAAEETAPRHHASRAGGQALRTRETPLRRADAPFASSDRRDESLRDASEADGEVESLKRRIAELEKKQLQRRLAALQAEFDVPETEVAEPAQRIATSSTRPRASVSPSDEGESRTPRFAPQERAAAIRPSPQVVPTGRPAASREEPLSAVRASKPTLPKSPSGEATLAYWNALNDVIAREGAMRAAPANVTAGNAGGFVEARSQAGRFAGDAISKLDAAGVDPEALTLGRDLVAWYQEEVELAERAKSLLSSNDVAARKGSAGNAWKGGEETHRRKCDEINRRGAELRTRLSRAYGLAFPPLN